MEAKKESALQFWQKEKGGDGKNTCLACTMLISGEFADRRSKIDPRKCDGCDGSGSSVGVSGYHSPDPSRQIDRGFK